MATRDVIWRFLLFFFLASADWKPAKSLFWIFEFWFLILPITYHQWKQAEISPNGIYCETRTYSPRAQSFINAHKKPLWYFLEGKVPKTSDKLKFNYQNRANLVIQGNQGNNSLKLSYNFAMYFPIVKQTISCLHTRVSSSSLSVFFFTELIFKKKVIWRFPVARSEEK